MSRDPGLKFRNFYFSPNFVLNFRKSYQIWEKLAQEQKVTGKKQIGGWKTPPPPSAYRVNFNKLYTTSPSSRPQSLFTY